LTTEAKKNSDRSRKQAEPLPEASLDNLYPMDSGAPLCRIGTPAPQQHAHWHNEIEVNLFLRGNITYQRQRRSQRVARGEVALFWAGIPHQAVRVMPGSQCAWIMIPLAWFLQWGLTPGFVRRVLDGEIIRSPIRPPFALEAHRLQRWNADLQSTNPELRRIVLLEIEAWIRRLVVETQPGGTPGGSVPFGTLEKLESMVNFMACRYLEPLTLAEIARAADLNPGYASKLFRTASGMSPHLYLLRLRVSHAQRLLACTDAKILCIALDSGFPSLSRFYDAFETFCHCSPKAYRQAVLCGSGSTGRARNEECL
jgi:AraC-like DNA-binding protein